MTSLSPVSSPPPSSMVSHPELAEHALSIRRPSSISSRTSHTTRRHRHNRSHHGGTSYQPQNEFPIFSHTGDVEIIISAGGQEKKYLLHRLILAQCSGFFEAGTSEEWSRAQAQPLLQNPTQSHERGLARIGEEEADTASTMSGSVSGRAPVKMRWRYELDWENKEDDEEPILVQKPPSSGTLFGGDSAFSTPLPPPSRTKPPPPSGGFFRSMANLTGIHSTTHLPSTSSSSYLNPQSPPELLNPTVRDYDNLFRIFYNHSPNLDATNIASAYSECKSLLTLADMYDALPVTGPRIDHHLLRFSSRLFKQIAKYPPSYLKLGYLARSRVIFAEALIHVVGQWPSALPHLRNSGFEVPDSVLELVEDKVDEMDELKTKAEARLFRLTLTTSRGERVNPSNAYLDWLAVSLFRQWLAENTTPPPQPILKHAPNTSSSHGNNATGTPQSIHNSTSTRPPPPRPPTPQVNTGRVYRLLGSSSLSAYLNHDELKRFLKLHPSDSLYSRDNMKRFERKMDEIKNLARDIVKPLMRNFLELDLRGESGGGLPYLTCTRVEDVDFPWD